MAKSREQELANRLETLMTDAFNRSINALKDAGAINTKEMDKCYRGIGSKYYDLVTDQMQNTARSGVPWICELFTKGDGDKK